MSPKDRASRHDPATAERVTSIIEAAERAAAALIDSADASAKRYLEEAEAEADRAVAARLAGLVELTDSLVEQAEAIRRESERLLGQLRRGVVASAGDGAGAIAGGDGAERSLAAAEEPPARPNHLAAVPAVPRSDNASGARLLATQMAVSGSSREEIEERLRSGFEIEDTASILDAILGPED